MQRIKDKLHNIKETLEHHSSSSTSHSVAPVNHEKVVHPVVVQETVHPLQKTEIQPVIHRERKQTEVQQITENLHQTELKPTIVTEKTLPAITKTVDHTLNHKPLPTMPVPSSSTHVDDVQKVQVVHEPIVQETIHKTIVEEIQPIVQRDVIQPAVLKVTQPIYEKVVEPVKVVHHNTNN
jgi:hypothetical protein